MIQYLLVTEKQYVSEAQLAAHSVPDTPAKIQRVHHPQRSVRKRSCTSNEKNLTRPRILSPQGHRESVALSHWKSSHNESLPNSCYKREVVSCSQSISKETVQKKSFSFLQILLTCSALFASFISSIFSFDLKNKMMLFQLLWCWLWLNNFKTTGT